MTADSLILAGEIELCQEGTIVTSGPATGCTFTLGRGFDLGSPAPVQSTITSALLDGDRVVGDREGNRECVLPVVIAGPSRLALALGREHLLGLVDENFTLAWTPAGMPTTMFDCYQASPKLTYSLARDRQHVAQVELGFQRMPFGRSPTSEVIETSGVPVEIDYFETVPGGTPGWMLVRTPVVQGTFAASIWTAGTATRTFPAKDLSDCGIIQFYSGTAGGPTQRAFWLSLTDSRGRVLDVGRGDHNIPGTNRLVPIRFALPASPANFDFTQVVRYTLRVSAGVFLDKMTGEPRMRQPISTQFSAFYALSGIDGSARAPANLELSIPSGSKIKTAILHRPPASALPNYTPILGFGGATIAGDGAQYSLANLVDGPEGVRFNSTYSIWLLASTVASGSRDLTVTFFQFWDDPTGTSGGSGYDWKKDFAFRAGAAATDFTDGLIYVGAVTLPVVGVPADNTFARWTVAVTSTNTTDRFREVLILDQAGQTVVMQSPNKQVSRLWVDEPAGGFADYGQVTGGSDRAHAVSVLPEVTSYSGGPLSVEPGELNKLLAFSPQGAPVVKVSYAPRWRTLRTA